MLDSIRAMYGKKGGAAAVQKAVVAATISVFWISALSIVPGLAEYSAYLLLACFAVCVAVLSYMDARTHSVGMDRALLYRLAAYLVLAIVMLVVMLL